MQVRAQMKGSLGAVLLTGAAAGCGGDPGYVDDDHGREQTREVHILDASGLVQAAGWARAPLFVFDRDRVPPDRALRIREWDYYGVTTPTFAFDCTLAKVGFEGTGVAVLGAFKIFDFTAGTTFTAQLVELEADDFIHFDRGRNGTYELVFDGGTLNYTMKGDTRVIDFTAGNPQTSPAQYMSGHVELDTPAGDSMSLVTPFTDPGYFFSELKVPNLTARGQVSYGERAYPLEAGQAFGVLDLVRAVIPHHIQWTWGYGHGLSAGKMVGINLGSVFGDEAHGTPDCVIVDGHLSKLRRVAWDYDAADATAPWTFFSEADGVSLTHAPTNGFVQAETTNLGFFRSQIHKPYGPWNGKVRLDDGTELAIEGILGGAEYVETTW